jgi:hypothetical protein
MQFFIQFFMKMFNKFPLKLCLDKDTINGLLLDMRANCPARMVLPFDCVQVPGFPTVLGANTFHQQLHQKIIFKHAS